MKLFLFLIMLITANYSKAMTTKECVEKFPTIKNVVLAAEPLQRAASGKSKLKFSELLNKATAAEKVANKHRKQIQALGCAEILHDIEPCLKPIGWSCETLPFQVDFDFLIPVKKSIQEEKALLSYQLLKSENVFKVCCNNLGCEEKGVGIPNILFEKNRLDAFVQLAAESSGYSNIALKSLQMSLAGLKVSQCSCETPKEKEMKRIAEELKSSATALNTKVKRAREVQALVNEISQVIAKGFPEKECKNSED